MGAGSSGPEANGSSEPSGVEARLQQLRQMQLASHQALARRAVSGGGGGAYYRSAPQTVDVRMYEQLVRAHNKMSKQLSQQEAYIDSLKAGGWEGAGYGCGVPGAVM